MHWISAIPIWAPWLAWMLYWRVSSRAVKPAVRIEPPWSRAAHLLPTLVAVLLLAINGPGRGSAGGLFASIVPPSATTYWTGVALLAAGLVYSVWARRTLGRNWSAVVVVKDQHELITSGPYACVRHPIYTGLLLAFAGTAVARDQWRGVLAVLLVLAAYWRKLLLEERYMRETFGERYEHYRSRTAALIPFLL